MKYFFGFHPLHSERKLLDVAITGITLKLSG
jgi:hypothetical protein